MIGISRLAVSSALALALFAGDLGRASLTPAPAAAGVFGGWGGYHGGWGGSYGGYGYRPVYGGYNYGYRPSYGYGYGYRPTYGWGGYRPYYGGGYGYYGRDHVSTGAVLVGALALGAIALAASQPRAPRYPVTTYPQGGVPRLGYGYNGYTAPQRSYYPPVPVGTYGAAGYVTPAYGASGYAAPAYASSDAFGACAQMAAQQGGGQASGLENAGNDGGLQWVTGVSAQGRFSCGYDGRQVAAFRFTG